MRAGSGALLVIVGLFVLYLAVTGRLARLPDALKYLNTAAPLPSGTDQPTSSPSSGPAAPSPLTTSFLSSSLGTTRDGLLVMPVPSLN